MNVQDVQQAAELLRRGRLVAFPTETVYGLGADATNSAAVQRIFTAKGRPSTNPLIVHVAGEAIAQRYAAWWPAVASKLAKRFWPGPLTIVLPKTEAIVPEVTAGLETVGLRVPNHPLALRLLRAFDGPVAAPSANRSNRLSPTTARHVREELGDAVDLILDGGPCQVGIESTVLSLVEAAPVILRPGGVSKQQIEAELRVAVQIRAVHAAAEQPAHSPGQQRLHYAPRTPAFRFDGPAVAIDDAAVGYLLIEESRLMPRSSPRTVLMPNKPDEYARQLYGILRRLDTMGLDAIYVQMPPDQPQWAAVRDRLRRATRTLV